MTAWPASPARILARRAAALRARRPLDGRLHRLRDPAPGAAAGRAAGAAGHRGARGHRGGARRAPRADGRSRAQGRFTEVVDALYPAPGAPGARAGGAAARAHPPDGRRGRRRDGYLNQQTANMGAPDSRAGARAHPLPDAGAGRRCRRAHAAGTRAAEMADGIAGARLVTVPQCGHLSTLERPHAVNEALLELACRPERARGRRRAVVAARGAPAAAGGSVSGIGPDGDAHRRRPEHFGCTYTLHADMSRVRLPAGQGGLRARRSCGGTPASRPSSPPRAAPATANSTSHRRGLGRVSLRRLPRGHARPPSSPPRRGCTVRGGDWQSRAERARAARRALCARHAQLRVGARGRGRGRARPCSRTGRCAIAAGTPGLPSRRRLCAASCARHEGRASTASSPSRQLRRPLAGRRVALLAHPASVTARSHALTGCTRRPRRPAS